MGYFLCVHRWLLILVILGMAATSRTAFAADTPLSESFDYGNSSSSLDGDNGGAGFGGPWSAFATYDYNPVNPTSQSYSAAGLVFGSNYLTRGGSNALVASTTAVGQNVVSDDASRPLNVTLTGTVYGSYLFKANALSGVRNYAAVAFGARGDSSMQESSGTLYIGAEDFNSFNTPGYGEINMGGTSVTLAGVPTAVGTTYAMLFELDNVGSAALGRVGTAWVLSQTQYDNLSTHGLLSPSALNSLSTGTAPYQVTQRGTADGYIATGKIDPTQFMTLSAIAFNNNADGTTSIQFDEVRLSSQSLADATGFAAAAPNR